MNFSYYKRERTVVPDIIHALDVTFLSTRDTVTVTIAVYRGNMMYTGLQTVLL